MISSICKLQPFLLCLAVCSFAAAALPKPAPRSTDDSLRDSLDAHAGDNYDRALMGEPDNANTKDRAKDDLEKKLKQQLGSAAQREDEIDSPLLNAAKGMHEAGVRIGERITDAVTQQVQRQVVADLEKIIDEAKKSGKSSGNIDMTGIQKPSGKPAGETAPRTTPPSQASTQHPAKQSNPDAKPPRDDRKTLARTIRELRDQYTLELQGRPREQMLELPSEYFLPEYEHEIEDYFRRLSSGKAAEEQP